MDGDKDGAVFFSTKKAVSDGKRKLRAFIVDFANRDFVCGVMAVDKFEAVTLACNKLKLQFKPGWTISPSFRKGKVTFVTVQDETAKPPVTNREVTSSEKPEVGVQNDGSDDEIASLEAMFPMCVSCGKRRLKDEMHETVVEEGGVTESWCLCPDCYVPF